jgi:hypothetical protein
MAVYDRNMFRGSRPTARGNSPKAATQAVSSMANMAQNVAGPMIQEGIAGVMKDMTAGVKAAEDYRGAMNAFRGDDKSVKERRQELGGIVGMKDANKTPESVLTLVQPVMEMREMGQVDQGIGQVAQKAMDTPVEGKMAQGIMQPVRMQSGGQASLAELYKQNLPMIQEIYGDDTDELRKRATGQFLLGTAAPLGLAIAQGMPIEEALMRGLPELGKVGAGVDAAKRKTRDAQRQAALNMATTQLAAQNELKSFAPGSAIYRGGVKIGTVPAKPEGPGAIQELVYTGTEPIQVAGFGTIQPNKPLTIGANELAAFPANIRSSFKKFVAPATEKFTSQTLYKKTDDGYESTFVTSLEQANTAKGQGFTEDSRPPGKQIGTFNFYRDSTTGKDVLLSSAQLAGMSATDREKYTKVPTEVSRGEMRDVTFRTPQVIAGVLRPAGTPFKMYDSEIQSLSAEARAQMIDAPNMADIKVLYKPKADGTFESKVVFTPDAYTNAINNEGFSPQTPEKFQFVKMYKSDAEGNITFKTARTHAEMNRMIANDFRPYSEEIRTLGNKVLSIAPTGTTVLATADDPATLFNQNGNARVVKNSDEALAARQAGFHFTSKPERKGLSVSLANALLVDLSDNIANGDFTQEELRQFQSAVSIVRDTPRITAGEGGEGLVTVGGTIPPHVIEAVRLAKERDASFDDMGLLETPQAAEAETVEYEGIIDPTIDYGKSIGPRDKLARGFAGAVDFGKALVFGDDYKPTNPAAFEAVRDLQYLNVITVTRALNAIGGKDTEGLRQRIESLQVDPFDAFLSKSKLLSSTSNMLSFLRDSKKTLNDKSDKAGTVQLRNKIQGDIGELDYLISQYEILETSLRGSAGGFGADTNPDPLNAPPLVPQTNTNTSVGG